MLQSNLQDAQVQICSPSNNIFPNSHRTNSCTISTNCNHQNLNLRIMLPFLSLQVQTSILSDPTSTIQNNRLCISGVHLPLFPLFNVKQKCKSNISDDKIKYKCNEINLAKYHLLIYFHPGIQYQFQNILMNLNAVKLTPQRRHSIKYIANKPREQNKYAPITV